MANYSKLTSQELDLLLEQYSLGKPSKISPFEGGQANSSYKITTTKGEFTLSVCDEKNSQEIENLTAIIENLEKQNFPTTRLVKTVEHQNFIFHKSKPVYVKKFIPGEIVRELTPEMLRQLGRSMAHLHSFEPLDSMKSSFPYGIEAFDSFLRQQMNHPYIVWLTDKKSYLEQAINPDMPKGFIHGDIFWDNLLFEKDSLVAILDFEEACHFYTLFDIGMTAVGCCSLRGSFNFSSIRQLLGGYNEISPFTMGEKAQLNVFIEYAAVATSFWRFRQYNVKHPIKEKAENYKEMCLLADQIHELRSTPILD